MDCGGADGKAVPNSNSFRGFSHVDLTRGTNAEQIRPESARIAESGFVLHCP
jgi:hypothetical protein